MIQHARFMLGQISHSCVQTDMFGLYFKFFLDGNKCLLVDFLVG